MSLKIQVIGSSSSGNGYIVESENKILLLELGCPYSDILKALNYNLGLQKLVGILVSHSHTDHILKQTYDKFIKSGIDIYSNNDVCSKFERINEIQLGTGINIAGFKVQPFSLEHSVENYGYLIDCPSGERICFATDCSSIPYKFKKPIDIFLVEANYDIDVVIEEVTNGIDVTSGFQNHMCISDTTSFLRQNFTGKCKKIILIHLSSTNSNAEEFKKTVSNALSFDEVYCASPNSVYAVESEF